MNLPADSTDDLKAARLHDAQAAPWAHGFFSLLRHVAARNPAEPAVGRAQKPDQEGFRLGQQASLAFSPREVARVGRRGHRWLIKTFGLGMLGPNGVLPLHYTDIVRERSENKQDETLADFLDLFHHRWLTHLYRAWAQAQAAAGLDREDEETFSAYVARLGGDDPDETGGMALSPHARWASLAHRVRQARNPDGLVSTLGRFFGVPVRLHEYRLAWMPIEMEDRCRLGRAHVSSVLGHGAMLGQTVPDRQTRFRLTLGPLDLRSYLRLTPQGSAEGDDLPVLVDLVRAFIGFEYIWEVELLVSSKAAPAVRLGDDHQLGWSTWMQGNAPRRPADQDAIVGMVFEPEGYVGSGSTPGRVVQSRTGDSA